MVCLDLLPEAICLIDPSSHSLISVNKKFECSIAPISKFKGINFLENFISKEDHVRFRVALNRVQEIKGDDESEDTETGSDVETWLHTPIVRDCSTLAIGSRNDYPIWRRYDWALSFCKETKTVIISGRMVTVVSAEKESSERELLDFLNKAPIAMHWLSGTGHILWANETEMNVLGYTAEEYVGQPIMKFCPDEEELVLEIFKTLGSGNTIKDVPVRFRAKNGDIKYLLIDSNVNWNPDGSFKHTRCFIRDDTSRKIREARLEERNRSIVEMAKAKDKFMRKVFHEIKTPCHLLSSTLECCDEAFDPSTLSDARHQARVLRDLVDDAVDAAHFDDGRVPVISPSSFSLYRRINELCQRLEEELGSRNNQGVEHIVSFGVSSGASADSATQNRNVLLVESNAGQRTLLKSMLSKDLKCICTMASDASAALAALKIGDFGAVLLGSTADMLQTELCAKFRHEDVKLPIIALVANPAAGNEQVAAGASKFVCKPVDRQRLKEAFEAELKPAPVLLASRGTWASGAGYSEQVPNMVEADWRYVSRVLRHLMTNALQHTQAGRVELRVTHELGRFQFAVCDTGSGVDPEEARRSFLRYWHLQPPLGESALEGGRTAFDGELEDLSTDKDGLGLGLNVSYNIVQSMGGELAVESHPGQTMFYFSLPLPILPDTEPFELATCNSTAAVTDPPNALKALAAQSANASLKGGEREAKVSAITADIRTVGTSFQKHPTSFKQQDFDDLGSMTSSWTDVSNCGEAGKHVVTAADIDGQEKRPPVVGLAAASARSPHCLVVDDNAICQKVAKKMLESLGCTVELASHGLEAVMAIKAAPWSFDFVLMDLRMPVMDGIDATTQIRKQLGLLSLPVVAFSAEVGQDVRELCREARFDGFIAKPAEKATLRAELDRLVIAPAAGQHTCAVEDSACSFAMEAVPTEAKCFGPMYQCDFDTLGACGIAPLISPLKQTASADKTSETAQKPLKGLEGLRVLVVDDNAICQKVARKMLERLGCSVRLAANGLEALGAIREESGIMAGRCGFDFVLMDLRMPVMDGIDATVRIRKELGMLSLPVVAFSAEVGQDVKDVCRDSGFDGFLSKPADRNALAVEILRLVSNSRSDISAVTSPAKTSDPLVLVDPKTKAEKVLAGTLEMFPGGASDLDIDF